ncbi:MAG: PepSY-like domain-containing protein [Gammaproteobacteria bacterium]
MQASNMWLGTGMGILLFLVAGAYADEEKLALDKVPKPVLEAVNARFKDAVMTGAAKERDDGKLVYEVSLDLKGQAIDVMLSPEGEIVSFEKAITVEDLPAAVVQALGDKYPKATYEKVEEVIEVKNREEKLAYYEAHLTIVENDKREVKLTPEGTIVDEE